MRRFLFWISGRLPCRIIDDNGQPYLERYFVCQALGVRCYLHRFVGSDPDRGLHDHPWRWALSVILCGRYSEQRRDGMHQRRWWNWIGGDTFHRIILPDGQREVWTLFVHSAANIKPWGFLRAYADGSLRWQSFAYPTGKNPNWERTAPRGRDISNPAKGEDHARKHP